MIVINEVLTDEDLYYTTYNKYYDKVLKDFNVRKKVVSVQFPDGEVHKMKINKFLVNMVFWKPFLIFRCELTKDFIFETSTIDANEIANYLDRIIDKFLDDENQVDLNFALAEIIVQLGYFSLDFNEIIGNTISLYDLTRLAKSNPEFKKIIYTRFGKKINTGKIEEELASKTKKILSILSSNKNCLQDYVNSKEGINKNQLTQFLINIGPKPDLKGNVYPKIVDTNFLTEGMTSPSDYYINSSGGRKAAITNHSKTKQSGYLMRKLSMLCMNSDLDTTTQDCGSQNYVAIKMRDYDTMSRCDKRFYVTKKGTLKLFEYNKIDKEKYLGKTLHFRSPVTCCCEDGKICKTCYGTLSRINYNIHAGILAILILTSQVTQKMLSSKHLLKTDTKKIEWDEIFLELFSLNGDTLTLNQTLDSASRYFLRIDSEDIQDNEEGLEDNSFDDEENNIDNAKISNINKFFKKFSIRRKIEKVAGKKYDSDYEEFTIDSKVDLYMSPYFENLLKDKGEMDDDGIYELPIKDIQFSKPLFYIEIENNELSAVLNNIINLIDKKERLGVTTYSGMVNKFLELVNESGIEVNSVHIEMIVRELIKSVDDSLKRPDFTQPNPNYNIMRLSESILNSNSVVTSISFERFKEQIYKAKTYRKNGQSLLDNFFV